MEETKKKKLIFIARAIGWFLFSAVLPFAFIAWRYGIFTSQSEIKINGLGIIGIIIAAISVMKLSKYIYKGMKPGMLKQCIHGFVTIVVPLVAIYAIINGIEGNLSTFKIALGFTILCETAAIPLDPFPEWLRGKENDKIENITDLVLDKVFKRKKDENK